MENTMTATADVVVTRESNIFLFHLLTEAAESFLDHVGDAQTFGNALVVDQHYAVETVNAMREDFGLVVR
jgi:hypothetical protein